MHRRSVAVFDRFLGALAANLGKAEVHCAARAVKPAEILGFRLYPDMFALVKQVQLACDFAARASARLAGETPRSFADTETTFAELQARIAAARAYMAGFAPADFTGAETRTITLKIGGQDRTLPGEDYLDFYAMPQFHFHLTTAYCILRHNGVEVGKRDYMGAA